jgi:hypothetical protein
VPWALLPISVALHFLYSLQTEAISMQTKANQYKPRPHYSNPISLQVLKTRMYLSIKKRSKSKNLPYLSKEEFINFTIQNSLKIENLYKDWKENKFMQKLVVLSM